MPAKRMGLQISNGSYYTGMFTPEPPSSETINISSKKRLTLSSSMIQRIHNVRPGCGSCGK